MDVVNHGTARALGGTDLVIGGKTGTAQIGTTDRNFAWFVSYAPADDPEIVIAVNVEQGGGVVRPSTEFGDRRDRDNQVVANQPHQRGVGDRQAEGDAACLFGQFLIVNAGLWVVHRLPGVGNRLGEALPVGYVELEVERLLVALAVEPCLGRLAIVLELIGIGVARCEQVAPNGDRVLTLFGGPHLVPSHEGRGLRHVLLDEGVVVGQVVLGEQVEDQGGTGVLQPLQVGVGLEDVESFGELRFRLSGVELAGFQLDGGRQELRGDTLVIRREDWDRIDPGYDLPYKLMDLGDALRPFKSRLGQHMLSAIEQRLVGAGVALPKQ